MLLLQSMTQILLQSMMQILLLSMTQILLRARADDLRANQNLRRKLLIEGDVSVQTPFRARDCKNGVHWRSKQTSMHLIASDSNQPFRVHWTENPNIGLQSAVLSFFLSDPSPIIGYACQRLTDWLTDWLTDSLLFSGLDGCEWYQLLDDVAIATESCEKLF